PARLEDFVVALPDWFPRPAAGTTSTSAAGASALIPERSARVTRAVEPAAVEFREFSREICEPSTAKRNSDRTLALALGLLSSARHDRPRDNDGRPRPPRLARCRPGHRAGDIRIPRLGDGLAAGGHHHRTHRLDQAALAGVPAVRHALVRPDPAGAHESGL